MAKIQYIKDKDNTTVFPVTHERAVKDSNGVLLETKLNGKQDTLVSGTNIKTVNGESILGSGDIVAGDPDAVKYVSQTLTAAQKAQARANIGAADEINGINSISVSVDNTSGSPVAEATLINQELSIAFSGLKGAQGNTGSSVEYPYELVNNDTTDDATKGASAAVAKRLRDDLTQLYIKVNALNNMITVTQDGMFFVDADLNIGAYIDSSGIHAPNIPEINLNQ